MRRVSSRPCRDEPLPEEQETEGERQLHNLLRQQLDTAVNIDQCVAKKRCFAPASLYKAFGEQASGVRSLTQFRSLQDGEKEQASLRELGLSEVEIELWQNRDIQGKVEKRRGLGVDPGAKQDRLRVIEEKITRHQEILSLPQRFSGSRGLSRREMEIEKAMFQGGDRHGFLRALYHQDEKIKDEQDQKLDTIYKDLLNGEENKSSSGVEKEGEHPTTDNSQSSTPLEVLPLNVLSKSDSSNPRQSVTQGRGLDSSRSLSVSQRIGKLSCSTTETPVKVTGAVESISEEEIRGNRQTAVEIRQIPRFQNYQQGEPSKTPGEPPLLYRLLTGRLKGQAFITFPDCETATRALDLVNGYCLMGKPIVIEFGRGRTEQQ
ncbi:RNA-binding protein 41 isoform X2 [Polyodon spathula]|uniref:RNA-binding protein 41 isoform X2 n=1 Tax=Polyodon spathula TaxID=7913 RepID=UPI001B7EB34B|nr:RNA-binding protein 41 isoform X2 [Polyodon spathula]